MFEMWDLNSLRTINVEIGIVEHYLCYPCTKTGNNGENAKISLHCYLLFPENRVLMKNFFP